PATSEKNQGVSKKNKGVNTAAAGNTIKPTPATSEKNQGVSKRNKGVNTAGAGNNIKPKKTPNNLAPSDQLTGKNIHNVPNKCKKIETAEQAARLVATSERIAYDTLEVADFGDVFAVIELPTNRLFRVTK